MFKAVLLALSFVLGLMHPTYSSQFNSEDVFSDGIFLNSPRSLIRFQIEKNFSLKTKLSNSELSRAIEKAIHDANPRLEGLSERAADHLARDVLRVSSCYGIDPVIFTSLIWRESNFKPGSLSERGAAGLTQMTNRGIQEVLERLSPTSHRRLGHLRARVLKCNPQFLARVPDVASADTLAAWKNSVSHSHIDALVMGALLLKLNLASVTPKASTNRLFVYQVALQKYNGDPKIKVQFAKDILLLAKRMMELPEVALNSSKFLSQIQDL